MLHQVRCHAGVATDQVEQVVAFKLWLGGMGGPDRADNLPRIGAAGQGCTTPCGAYPEDDSWVLGHPQRLIDERLVGAENKALLLG
jgi:hypothetical protein